MSNIIPSFCIYFFNSRKNENFTSCEKEVPLTVPTKNIYGVLEGGYS
nr:MAG TPA: hypothetical protein [Caudoviricetes sp.]